MYNPADAEIVYGGRGFQSDLGLITESYMWNTFSDVAEEGTPYVIYIDIDSGNIIGKLTQGYTETRTGGQTIKSIKISPTGSEGGIDTKTPIICSGCILGDKCIPVGYRSGNKYCNIESELAEQKKDEVSCSNAYECESNICEKNLE